jgi:putative hydrolase of the HAD superfamily
MSKRVSEDPFEGVKVIALDAVGTLIHTAQPVAQSYVEVAARHGVQVSQEIIADRFSKAIARHSLDFGFDSLGLATNEDLERAWWRGFIAEVFDIDTDQAHIMFDDLWNYFARPDAWCLYEDAIEFIEFLEARQFPWVIASNFDARLHAICQNHAHLSKAQSVFVSSEVNWRKPSIHFFRHIESQLQRDPASILMIGDDQVADFDAAKNAGWQAIRLERKATPRPGELANLADIPRQMRAI